MAPEAKLLYPAGERQFDAGANLVSGEIIQLDDGRAAVVNTARAITSGDPAVARTDGIYRVDCAAATEFALGDAVYWDSSASQAVASPGASDDPYLGTAVRASSSSEAFVEVDLNSGHAGAGSLGHRGCFSSIAVVLDHADATEPVIIAASENPNGLLVVSFHGIVTETIVGSSEDQLILQLLDEDDNVLSVITTTNTSPDVANDVVIGTRSLANGTTGDVGAVIPADKAAKVKVSQATAGTPAGKVRVSALVCPLI